MPTGLHALRDHDVHSARFEVACLVDGRGARQHERAPAFHPVEQVEGGQAEVEAHHGGTEGFEDVGRVVIEGSAQRTGARLQGQAELLVVRSERLAPRGFPVGVGRRHGVTEEVDVEGCRAERVKGAQFVFEARGVEGGGG